MASFAHYDVQILRFDAIFIRERNTSQSVIDIFNSMYELLGPDSFKALFPVIIADNGSEFSNPSSEYDAG